MASSNNPDNSDNMGSDKGNNGKKNSDKGNGQKDSDKGNNDNKNKGYSTFDHENSKSTRKGFRERYKEFRKKAKDRLELAILPNKHDPPATLGFLKKRFPKAVTHKNLNVFTFLYLALVYVAYHMSRLPFSVAKTVLHPRCSGMTAALHVSGIDTSPDTCGWAPFDKPNYTILFGVMDYCYTFTYSISMVLITGPLADRLRPRTFISLGLLLSGASTALFGLGYHLQIHSFWYYVFCMVLLGIFQSTGLPPIISILTEWTEKSKRGKMMSMWSVSMFLGNILGALIPGQLVTGNWAWAFYVPGACMAALGLVSPFFIFASPKEMGFTRDGQVLMMKPDEQSFNEAQESSMESGSEKSPLVGGEETVEESVEDDDREAVGLLEALKVSGVLEFAFSLFFVKFVCYTALYWLPKMMNEKGFDPKISSYLTAIFDAGGMAGALFAGILSDRLDYAALIVSLSLSAGMPPLLALNHLDGYPSLPYYILFLLLAGILVNGPYAYIVSVVSSKKGEDEELQSDGKERKGTATVAGVIDGIGSFGGALGPLIAGYVAGINYKYIIHVFIVALVLGVLVLSRQIVVELMRACRKGKAESTQDSNDLDEAK